MSTAGTANAIWNTKVRSKFVPAIPDEFKDAQPYALRYDPTPPESPIKRHTRGTVTGGDSEVYTP